MPDLFICMQLCSFLRAPGRKRQEREEEEEEGEGEAYPRHVGNFIIVVGLRRLSQALSEVAKTQNRFWHHMKRYMHINWMQHQWV